MLTLNNKLDNLIFKDITKEDLRDVLNLYNQNDQNVYATGIDRRMSLRDINEKYLEVLVNSHEFFTGIFLDKDDVLQLVGVVKGRIDYENSEEAWISSILVDNRYQRLGIGTKAVETLIDMLNKSYDVKRFYIGIIAGNNIGRCFWQKLEFSYFRTIEQYIKLKTLAEDFIIMKKEIT
ncbi:MAG: GNAT family N-acetyltransferase [Clostridiaceae bacterium]|jgi:RimJ/RimL family protein N-acetyltransferase|nr:GNAT family N-acetyltransferase [Clostridiaceae bacterium]